MSNKYIEIKKKKSGILTIVQYFIKNVFSQV